MTVSHMSYGDRSVTKDWHISETCWAIDWTILWLLPVDGLLFIIIIIII